MADDSNSDMELWHSKGLKNIFIIDKTDADKIYTNPADKNADISFPSFIAGLCRVFGKCTTSVKSYG